LLPLFVLMFAFGIADRAIPRTYLGLLALAYLAVGTVWLGTERFVDTPLSVLQAPMFLGGVLALGLMYEARRLEPAAPAP
jgi:hypothetical protein